MKDSEAYQPTDRRPINSRQTNWARRIAQALADKNISANAISVLGMVAAILAGVAFAMTDNTSNEIVSRGLWLLGGLLCQVRLLCNLFDGMVAIAQAKASAKGELYNEVPDRVSDAAILIGLGCGFGGSPFVGALAAMVAVFVAYVRAMGKTVGAPNDFCGPMAKPQRMAIVTVLAAFMCCAPGPWRNGFQAQWLGGLMLGLTDVVLWGIVAGCVITAGRRLARTAKFLEGEAP